MVELGQQPGHGGLARAGIAQEHQVEGHGGHRQIGLLAQLAHLHQVDEALDVLLDLAEAAQSVQLRHELLQGGLGLRRLPGLFGFGLLLPLGRPVGAACLHRGAVGAAGDEVLHVQGAPAPLHPRPVAVGGHGVGAGVDKPRLRLAHHPVGGGEQQQHQGEGVHKAAAQALIQLQVHLHQPPEKVGQHKALVLGHLAGQLPVQGGGHRVSLAVDGVIVLHVDRGQPLVLLPHAAGALPQEAVRLPAEGHPGRRVWDLTAEGGHGLVILLVDGRRAERLLHIWPRSLEGNFCSARAGLSPCGTGRAAVPR